MICRIQRRFTQPVRSGAPSHRASEMRSPAQVHLSKFSSLVFACLSRGTCGLVIVANIPGKQTLQVSFIHSDHVVPPATLDPSLGHTILPGTFERGSHRPHRQRSDCRWNLKFILPIPIKDQKSGSRSEWERFTQLLDDPEARQMTGNVQVENAPPIMSDHEEAVEHAERDGWDRKEIRRSNGFPVITEKGQPAFGWLGSLGVLIHREIVRSEISKPSVRSSP